MNTKAMLLLFSWGLALSGCSYALEEVGIYKGDLGDVKQIGALQFSEKKINFEVVKSLSLRTCLQCHTEGNKSMNTPEKVLALKDTILSEINDGSMPPRSSGYKPLTDCEQKVLETWIDDQLHNRTEIQKVKDLSACAGAEAPQEKPATDFKNLEVSFENLKTEILAPKCLSCHSVEKAKKTVLEDLEHINEKGLIKKTAEESVLFQVCVPGMNKRFMPPKKSGIPALTTEELDYLKRWIEKEGAETP